MPNKHVQKHSRDMELQNDRSVMQKLTLSVYFNYVELQNIQITVYLNYLTLTNNYNVLSKIKELLNSIIIILFVIILSFQKTQLIIF